MKFQPDTPGGVNSITRLEPGRLWVGSVAFGRSVLVPWQGDPQPWEVDSAAGLTPAHFERIAALKPEVVIYGSGATLRFPAPALLRALYERRIGLETMDTPAACRTFNVLVGEGRQVVGALLLEPPA